MNKLKNSVLALLAMSFFAFGAVNADDVKVKEEVKTTEEVKPEEVKPEAEVKPSAPVAPEKKK